MTSSREGVLLRGSSAARAVGYREAAGAQPEFQPSPVERRATIRRAADQPVNTGNGRTFRLGDVYADELERLRAQARTEGYATGNAEGMRVAARAVAAIEQEAAERLADVQARWERRLVSATAAVGAAAAALEQIAVPIADDIRETIIGTVMTLVEDLLGRELVLAQDPAMDAVRRALTLLPADAPAVVRLHPDDLAEIAAEDLAALPDSVRVLGDPAVERAGAVAESGPLRVDAQLRAALERVQEVLTS